MSFGDCRSINSSFGIAQQKEERLQYDLPPMPTIVLVFLDSSIDQQQPGKTLVFVCPSIASLYNHPHHLPQPQHASFCETIPGKQIGFSVSRKSCQPTHHLKFDLTLIYHLRSCSASNTNKQDIKPSNNTTSTRTV